MMPTFSQDELKSRLHYDPETGIFTRSASITNAKKGDVAGSIKSSGYRYISVFNRQHAASRLAWLYMTGCWPTNQVDHKNRNKSDDRWDNLREATRSQNQANRSSIKNSSGAIGVSWHSQAKKWQAQICHNKKSHYLGIFDRVEDAASAYVRASAHFFGEFARASK